jgi:hypothetical protein
MKKSLITIFSIYLSVQSLFGGLVAHYGFENNTLDSNGALNLGQTGSITYGTGQFGDAVNFDGASFLWSNSADFNIGGSDFSVSLWYQTDVTTGFQPLVSKNSNNTDKGWAVNAGGSSIYGDLNDTTGGEVGFANPNSNNFHHVVFQREENTLELYFDGVLVDTDLVTQHTVSNNSFTVGSRNTYNGGQGALNGATPFTGLIDELWVFDNALTQAEINNLFNSNSLAAVPEPATFSLVLMSLMGLGFSRRKTTKV